MSDRKIILVCFPAWRTGSSMVTGFLEKAGCSVGAINGNHDHQNPYGYFEIDKLQSFLKENFAKHLDAYGYPDSVEKLTDTWRSCGGAYDKLISEVFGGAETIAMKCQHFCMCPLYEGNENVYGISLTRELEGQYRSFSKVKHGEFKEDFALLDWLTRIRRWTSEYRQKSKIKFIDVTFEDMLDYPIDVCNKITDFAGLGRVDESVITDWVRPEFSRSRKG